MWMCLGIYKICTLVIIIEFKRVRPNELLLLVCRVVIFGIIVNNQLEVCDESRLSLGLDDRANETSLIPYRMGV